MMLKDPAMLALDAARWFRTADAGKAHVLDPDGARGWVSLCGRSMQARRRVQRPPDVDRCATCVSLRCNLV